MLYRLLPVFIILLAACTRQLPSYEFPKPVDTSDKAISLQKDQLFITADGITATNEFPGARLASFKAIGPKMIGEKRSLFLATIPAENQPINKSPWYAFGINSTEPRTITLKLEFPEGVGNRYLPKIAKDLAGPWTYLPYNEVDTNANILELNLNLTEDWLYVAGQEVLSNADTENWLDKLFEQHSYLQKDSIGQSVMGETIWGIEFYKATKDKRPAIVLLGRQHPPEVSGWLAFQAFFERLTENDEIATNFRQRFRILAIPTLNPDGVDEGHWRHNANGIDLNRDWDQYRQPEVRAAVNWLTTRCHKNQVVWGLDFHSTQYDVMYTHDPSLVQYRNVNVLKNWLQNLEEWTQASYPGASAKDTFSKFGRPLVIGQDTLRVEPEGIARPTSANWIAQHFKTIAVTYEVADEQDRDYIRAKARKSATLMMEELLKL